MSVRPAEDTARPPLMPSEKDNAGGVSRRPRTKEIASRKLSSTSITDSTPNSASSPKFSSRRFPSPLLNARPSPSPAKRSQSVDRNRPSIPRQGNRPTNPHAPGSELSSAARALCTTTRSLSVSFQGESFFYQTSRAKVSSPIPARKPTAERRRFAFSIPSNSLDHSDNFRPFDVHQHRWPAASHSRFSNSLTRSLDCSLDQKEPMLSAMRLLNQATAFEEGARRASFDASGVLSASSDTDSVSSGSNSGTQEFSSRVGRLPHPGAPFSSLAPRIRANSKLVPVMKQSLDSPSSSPSSTASCPRGLAATRASSPSKFLVSPSRGGLSPMRTRGSTSANHSVSGSHTENMPSILSFAAKIRRGKKGENRVEEAHCLRLFNNRQLQWQWVNARTSSSLLVQRLASEKIAFDAWLTISDLRDSVSIKKIKLHLLKQSMKLTSILKGQVNFIEEWFLMDRDHLNSLSGAIEALRSSTLRLPIVGGARACIQEIKDAVGSAVDVMQAMGSSICVSVTKVQGMGPAVSELARVAAQEQALLNQSRVLLSIVAALQVKTCSLQSHALQLKCQPCPAADYVAFTK